MGTIVIEELVETGDANGYGQPIYKGLVAVTNDATTSGSDETVTLDNRTNYISVTALEAHRVGINSATTGSVYYYVGANERRDIAVPTAQGATISYRTNAA